jgi:Cu/Ag efflux protein CusF
MVFVAKDKSLLDKAKAGDKVRFMTIHENGQMIVTELQPR